MIIITIITIANIITTITLIIISNIIDVIIIISFKVRLEIHYSYT